MDLPEVGKPYRALAVLLQLQAFRFVFHAPTGIYFPEGKAASTLRGAFGTLFRKLTCAAECESAATCAKRSGCPYARMFEPRGATNGPSGLRDWPRPFVFRASHLDGRSIEAGGSFDFDMHLFDLKTPALEHLIRTFTQLAQEGLGASRKPVELLRVESISGDGCAVKVIYAEGCMNPKVEATTIRLPLSGETTGETKLEVRFVTPTELKGDSRLVSRPDFGILAARIRDRVSTLCELYGDGAPNVDFKLFGERASAIRMTRWQGSIVQTDRRSSRTGQVHSIGGFVGKAEYEGNVGEFIPWLRAARWTGVGRQTVWGKGVVEIDH